jgi:hypothetical protein
MRHWTLTLIAFLRNQLINNYKKIVAYLKKIGREEVMRYAVIDVELRGRCRSC